MDITIIITEHSNGKYSSAARHEGVKGTHEDYNMIHNSRCDGEYFDSEQDSLDAAHREMFKYSLDKKEYSIKWDYEYERVVVPIIIKNTLN